MQTNIKYLLVSFIFLLTCFSFAQKTNEKFVVVLDAGHGGKDPGNLGNGFKEKDIALNIILKIGKGLEKHEGIEVIYTRKTDVFIDLFVRGKIANKADADLYWKNLGQEEIFPAGNLFDSLSYQQAFDLGLAPANIGVG